MKTIIITGASGMLATELIFKLATNENQKIIAVTSNIDYIAERYKNIKQLKICTIDNLNGNINSEDDLCCIHCAFSRSENPLELAKSLFYTEKLITILINNKIKQFINISSQSVYGQIHEPLWKENLDEAPSTLYAMAKYSAERITSALLSNKNSIMYTNVRLASLNTNARFVNVFVKNAIKGENINIIGGKQKVSFLDVRDATDALIKMIFAEKTHWQPIYNLGSGKQNSIIDFAMATKTLTQDYDLKPVNITIQKNDKIELNAGMDNSLFCSDFNWQPLYDYIDMVKTVYNIHLKERKKERISH